MGQTLIQKPAYYRRVIISKLLDVMDSLDLGLGFCVRDVSVFGCQARAHLILLPLLLELIQSHAAVFLSFFRDPGAGNKFWGWFLDLNTNIHTLFFFFTS